MFNKIVQFTCLGLVLLVSILAILVFVQDKRLETVTAINDTYSKQNQKLVKDYQDRERQISAEKKKSFDQADKIKHSTNVIMKTNVPTNCESAIQWAITQAVGV